jgi:hypothetical protein
MVLWCVPSAVCGFVAPRRTIVLKTQSRCSPLFRRQLDDPLRRVVHLSSSPKDKTDDVSPSEPSAASSVDRTTFDEAGRSLVDEQDMKRMDAMGDFDANPNVGLRMN